MEISIRYVFWIRIKVWKNGTLVFAKKKRNRIDAIAEAGGFGPIIKNMAQMSITTATLHFGSLHSQGIIGGFFDNPSLEGLIKTRPTCARIELGGR